MAGQQGLWCGRRGGTREDARPRRDIVESAVAVIRRARAVCMPAPLVAAIVVAIIIVPALLANAASTANAQLRTGEGTGLTLPAPPKTQPREKVHADISTRSVRITSSFTGTEIIVFGSIEHGRPEIAANEDLYDVVVVLEGTLEKLVSRRKSNIAGIWINTQGLTFDQVPSYYAISSSRPLDEIASPLVLRNHNIGFDQIRLDPVGGWESGITTADLRQFKQAVIRLKMANGLYVQNDYGVEFVGGASLFRTTIGLPANVPVGTLNARVLLFRRGQMLSQFRSQVLMQREGIERLLHDFAFGYPLLYGITAVLIAAGAGMAASSYFSRRRR